MDEYIKEVIKETTNERNFRQIRKNGLFLNDYQIEILEQNDICWKQCTSTKQLLFLIEECLNEKDDEQLDLLAEQLQEQNYYSNTNK